MQCVLTFCSRIDENKAECLHTQEDERNENHFRHRQKDNYSSMELSG